MLSDKAATIVGQQLIIARIIHLSLVSGVVAFAIVAMFFGGGGNNNPPLPRMDLMMAGVGLLFAIGGWVLPRIIAGGSSAAATSATPDDELRLVTLALSRLQSAMIVGWAMFEGGAFANLVEYYMEQKPLNLIVAAILLFFLLLQFPMRGAILDAVEARLRQQHEDRQLTGYVPREGPK